MPPDPRTSQPTPPFRGDQQQPAPGLSSKMDPPPDHGEDSYVGKGALAGRVALITGGDSGIGRAVAIAFAREGADVAISYLPVEQSDAEDTAAWVEKAGRRALLLPGDIQEEVLCHQLVADTVAKLGKIDILVNNAGVERHGDFVDVSEADYDLVLDVNLKGPFFATQAFVRRLLQANLPGCVINISSVHEDMVFPHFASYCASKGGVRMLMRDLAVELGPKNITVNNIAPGAIMTPINTALMGDRAKLDPLLRNIPLGRMGTVEDVAGIASFLASADAAYVTGSTYVVDGGLMRSYHEQ